MSKQDYKNISAISLFFNKRELANTQWQEHGPEIVFLVRFISISKRI
jgi:hypothetical protein